MGEADLPAPPLDLAQLRVHRQKLRDVLAVKHVPSLGAVPSPGLGQWLPGGEKEQGLPMGVWVPAALPASEPGSRDLGSLVPHPVFPGRAGAGKAL